MLNKAKGTYLTAAVQRCCSGVTLFLSGIVLFLQRCFIEKRCGGTCVFGCLHLQTCSVERAFFAYVWLRRWNVYVPVVHMQRISNSRPPANFQCTTGAFNSNFRIRRNMHFSRYNLKPPQQLGISFIDCGISFVRIVDFFYILCRSLKNYKVYGFDLTYLLLLILQYLSFKIYPLEPILQNLSSRTYPLEPILQ